MLVAYRLALSVFVGCKPPLFELHPVGENWNRGTFGSDPPGPHPLDLVCKRCPNAQNRLNAISGWAGTSSHRWLLSICCLGLPAVSQFQGRRPGEDLLWSAVGRRAWAAASCGDAAGAGCCCLEISRRTTSRRNAARAGRCAVGIRRQRGSPTTAGLQIATHILSRSGFARRVLRGHSSGNRGGQAEAPRRGRGACAASDIRH